MSFQNQLMGVQMLKSCSIQAIGYSDAASIYYTNFVIVVVMLSTIPNNKPHILTPRGVTEGFSIFGIIG